MKFLILEIHFFLKIHQLIFIAIPGVAHLVRTWHSELEIPSWILSDFI